MPGSDAVAESTGLRTHPLTAIVQGAVFAAAATIGLFGSMMSGEGLGNLHPVLAVLIALAGGMALGLTFGFVTWRFTRYVIDGTGLRINSGVITKASRRIPYERIQSVDIAEPIVARALGLAELRIEMAGGKESRTTLKFLRLSDAQDLRHVLLSRAHGEEVASSHDEQRSIITRVPPERIVIGTLLSLDFVFAAAGTIALVAAAIWFNQIVIFLGGVIPLATWLGQIAMGRVVQQWDFTLSRGERGLRIERGLLSRTSQTIPWDRVQGIAIKEPFVWRRFGWQRLEVDIAGYAAGAEEQGQNSSSTLLPITDPALAQAIIGELLPGTSLGHPARADLVRTGAPGRSSIFAPVGWRYRWIAADPATFIAHEGWIEQTTSIVPPPQDPVGRAAAGAVAAVA
ncbi:PH domain-containing protein [Aeromicrobium sp. UC242_57]|uniref:PH domain-containing protein n=1 Tax=Aeromicrobium sp. UC242_57 TaxID=3374624 RepID=UPI0037A2E328